MERPRQDTGAGGRSAGFALALLGVALLVAWWIFHVDLPWWASALLLASSVVTALEAVHLARNQGAGSDG